MDAVEHLRQAAESIAAHPRRVIASSTGIFWGAAAMIVLLGWVTGFRDYMRAELSRFGHPLVFMSPGVTSSGFPGHRAGVPVRISRADVAAAERAHPELLEALLCAHVSSTSDRALVRAGERVRRLDLAGVDHRFGYYRNFAIAHGRALDGSDVARRASVAVLGNEAAEELFGSPGAAVGGRIRVDGHALRVVGVAARKGRQYMNLDRPDNRLLMVPVTTAEERFGHTDREVRWIAAIPRSGAPAGQVVDAVIGSLAERAGFHPDDEDAFRWFDSTEMLHTVDLLHTGFSAFIGAAGAITLLVAGIGVANFQLATIAERSVELGVARALGARAGVLMAQAVVEALLVSGAAALLGVATGFGICAAIEHLAPPGVFPAPVVSGPTLAITAAALTGVSAIAALVPALRVRAVDVAVALRAAA